MTRNKNNHKQLEDGLDYDNLMDGGVERFGQE